MSLGSLGLKATTPRLGSPAIEENLGKRSFLLILDAKTLFNSTGVFYKPLGVFGVSQLVSEAFGCWPGLGVRRFRSIVTRPVDLG